MRLARGFFAVAYPFAVFAFVRWLQPHWDARALLLVPVFLNLGLLFVFGRTLHGGGPTLIERFARMRDRNLSPARIRHCRTATIVWCGFFATNATVCLALAWSGRLGLWTLYTGCISYLLMALLFGVEWLVRSWRFHHLSAPWADPLLRRFFPEGPAA
jgi:uncharacterized membrane protein